MQVSRIVKIKVNSKFCQLIYIKILLKKRMKLIDRLNGILRRGFEKKSFITSRKEYLNIRVDIKIEHSAYILSSLYNKNY